MSDERKRDEAPKAQGQDGAEDKRVEVGEAGELQEADLETISGGAGPPQQTQIGLCSLGGNPQ